LNEKLQATQAQLRSTLYAAHMNLAQHTWDTGGAERARELLELYRPKEAETDLRRFEWHYLYRLCHAELLTIKAHTRSVAFSPDGTWLPGGMCDLYDAKQAYAALERKVWDSQTGQQLLTLKAHMSYVGNVAFSPDGKRLASASSRDGTVKMWDAQTGQELL